MRRHFCRGDGLGDELMPAPRRMELKGARRIELSVTRGNVGMLPFYRSHSFSPRSVALQRKGDNNKVQGAR